MAANALTATDAQAVGRLLPALLHDLNNHLAALRMQTGLLEHLRGDPAGDLIPRIVAQTERIAGQIALVQDLIREGRGFTGGNAAGRSLARLAKLVAGHLQQAGIRVDITGDGDGQGVRWALIHLLLDAERLEPNSVVVVRLGERRFTLREPVGAAPAGPGRALARASLAASATWADDADGITVAAC